MFLFLNDLYLLPKFKTKCPEYFCDGCVLQRPIQNRLIHPPLHSNTFSLVDLVKFIWKKRIRKKLFNIQTLIEFYVYLTFLSIKKS